jgi:hypothetical protein
MKVGSHVYLYTAKPVDNGMCFQSTNGEMYDVDAGAFPDLKPGECRRLVMESEESE